MKINPLNVHHIAELLAMASEECIKLRSSNTDWVNCTTGVANASSRLVRTAKSVGVDVPTDDDDLGQIRRIGKSAS